MTQDSSKQNGVKISVTRCARQHAHLHCAHACPEYYLDLGGRCIGTGTVQQRYNRYSTASYSEFWLYYGYLHNGRCIETLIERIAQSVLYLPVDLSK